MDTRRPSRAPDSLADHPIQGGLPSSLTVPTLYQQQHTGDFSQSIPLPTQAQIASGGVGTTYVSPTNGCAIIAASVADPTLSQTTGCVYDPNPASPGYLRNPIASNVIPAGFINQAATFSSGASSYNALQATFERRFKNGLGFSANTTYARLLDDAPNVNGQSGNGVGQILGQAFRDYGNGRSRSSFARSGYR